MRPNRDRIVSCAVLLTAMLIVPVIVAPTPAMAATLTWDAVSASCNQINNNWSAVACWQGGAVPSANGDVVVISPQGCINRKPGNYDLNSSLQLGSITFNCSQAYTITGGPIGLASAASVTDNNTNLGPTAFGNGFTLNGPATLTANSGTHGMQFNGAIGGTGGLTATNNGPADGLQLNVANSYTGATTVGGTARVVAAVNGAVPATSALTVNGSALFQAVSTVGSLAGAGNVFMNGNNALTVGGDNTSTTFSGVYQNSGGDAALTKTGTGTLTLSGANTHTGATTVNAGTLLVNGSQTVSPVSVAGGAVLGGIGTVGSITSTGGTVAPGASPGTLAAAHAVSLDAASTFSVEANGVTPGTQHDQLEVTISGSIALGGSTLAMSFGFTPAVGDTFTIIDNRSSGAVGGEFGNAPAGTPVTFGSVTGTVSYTGGTGNDVVFTASATPTMSTQASTTGSIAVSGPVGGRVRDRATVSGAVNPTGNLTFNVFGPGDTTCSTVLGISNKPFVNGTIDADDFAPSIPGTYRWTASYPGDANNAPVSSGCNAPGESSDIYADTQTTVVASPEPSVAAQNATFTATVVARGPAGTPPGTVTFTEGATVLAANVPVNGSGQASFSTSAMSVGNHTVTANYTPASGSFFLASNGSVTHTVVATRPCTRTVTGRVGPVTASSGEQVCVQNADVGGNLTVNPGGGVSVYRSRVQGSATASSPTSFVLCGSSVSGSVSVSNATGLVEIGDWNNEDGIGCGPNAIGVDVIATANTASTEISGNGIGRDLSLTGVTGQGPFPDDTAPELEGNRIVRNLSCSGNTPPPTNDGTPNRVGGVRSGQCATL